MGLIFAPAMRVPARARQESKDQQSGFSDGLNTVSNDFALTNKQMRRSDNVRLAEIGAATKRGGTWRTAAALASAAVKNGFGWRQSASAFYALAMSNGSLFKATYGVFPMTWTSIGSGFALTTPTFSNFRDGSANVVYIATGGVLKKWDGTTLSSATNAVQATGVTVYNERLWGWGVAASLDSIFYGPLDNGDSLGYGAGGGGQIIVRTFGQQDIVACAPVNTSLLIFHRRGISRLTGYGASDITVSPAAVTADVGLVGKEAVCVYDNVAYFVSNRGVYRANEAEVFPLATPEKPDIVLPQLLSLSSTDLAAVKCNFNRNTSEVWVQLPGLGIYIWNTLLSSWSGPFVDGYLTPDTTCLFETLDANNQPVMLRGDSSGFVSLCDSTTYYLDNVPASGTGGTTYNAVIQCHRMYSGDATQANAYRWAEILASLSGSTSVNISWNTLSDANSYQVPPASGGASWGGSDTTWGAGTWGRGGQSPFYVPLSGTGPFIDITITDTGSAASQYASVQVLGYSYGRR